MVPGRYPSFSPASIAGLVRIMRETSFLKYDERAIAMAR